MTTTCWSCQRPHTGYVWCPHCRAPVDTGSEEARRSLSWQQDPRNHHKVGLSAEIEAYQALLEGHRAHPDDDDLAEDLERARAAMEVAWLNHLKTEHPPMHTPQRRTVSHHLLRRRARAASHKLNLIAAVGVHYTVEKTVRGPWRWRVVCVSETGG